MGSEVVKLNQLPTSATIVKGQKGANYRPLLSDHNSVIHFKYFTSQNHKYCKYGVERLAKGH